MKDPAKYIANSLSPAKVVSVAVNEEEKNVQSNRTRLSIIFQLLVKKDKNARLAAKLTGWKIDIKSETQAAEEGFDSDDMNMVKCCK